MSSDETMRIERAASANPLFRDSAYSNYHNSTVFDSDYSIRYHRVPVPRESSADTARLQYRLHKVTSQNISKSHHLPHPHPHSTTTIITLSNVHAQHRHSHTSVTDNVDLHRPDQYRPAAALNTAPQRDRTHRCVSFFFLFTNYFYRPHPCLHVHPQSAVHLSEGRGQNNQQPTPNDNNKRVVVFLCGSGI